MGYPLWIELTPEGKTVVFVPSGNLQEDMVNRIVNIMGEPELVTYLEDRDPDNIWLVFPHQNLPEALKDVAERMTSEVLLADLGV